MFIGHYAPALIAAAHPKSPNLGTLFIGAQLVDFAFFGFVLAGIEKMQLTDGITAMNSMDLYHMPYTHSLLGGTVWALVFAAVIFAATRNRTGAIIAGAVVLSHWFVDLIVHAPDLTLHGGPPKLGFGLWDYPLIEMPLEIVLTGAALAYYTMRSKSENSSDKRIWILGGMLFIIQLYNWFAPEPEELTAAMPISALLAFTGLAWLAYWAGKNRKVEAAT